jgi:hypothetical protein
VQLALLALGLTTYETAPPEGPPEVARVASFEGLSAKVVDVVVIDSALWLTAATTKL